jgi:hypothetical protein
VSDSLSKVVFHVVKASREDIERISAASRNVIQSNNISGAQAQAGMSPMFRNQWDLIVFHVPLMVAGDLEKEINDGIRREFSKE